VNQHRRRIDQVADPLFVADLETIPMDELRRRRRLVGDLDTELSYYRRLLHGRMDLLAFEMRRRRGEEERTLLEALPEILADQARPVGGDTMPKDLPIEAPDIPERGRRNVDRVLRDDFLARLPSLDDAELEEIQASLTEVEREVSAQRATVYAAHEAILGELTRRYREGLADVDGLLSGS